MRKAVAILLALVLLVSVAAPVSAAKKSKKTRSKHKGTPDLTLTSDDISFSPSEPMDGETVIITATIHNVGTTTAKYILVNFYKGPPAEGQLIGAGAISSIKAGKSKSVSVEWTAELGTHEIFVVVDPADKIREKDENNNVASKSITVGPWVPPPPYVINVESVTMENWSSVIDYYEGVKTIKVMADLMEVSGLHQSEFEMVASSFSGSNVTIYATKIVVGLIELVAEEVTQDDLDWIKNNVLTDDPITLLNVETHALCIEALDVTLSGYESATYPKEVTQTVSRVRMSGWKIVKAKYNGTNGTNGIPVSKITARELEARELLMSIDDYRIVSPMVCMNNATIYATYVKGKALGTLPLEWSGDKIPRLVKLGQKLLPVILMTDVTMRAVCITADHVTISALSQTAPVPPITLTPTSVEVDPFTFTIGSGENIWLTAIVSPEGAGTITWTTTAGSCNPSIGLQTNYTAPIVYTQTVVTVTATLSPAPGYAPSSGISVGTITPAEVPFSISVIPESVVVMQGSENMAIVMVERINPEYSLMVELSASGQPENVFVEFDLEENIPPFASIMIISASPYAPAGTYEITITGTGEDTWVNTATCLLTVIEFPVGTVIEFPVGPTRFELGAGSMLEILMWTYPIDNTSPGPENIEERSLESVASFVVVAETPVNWISNFTVPAENFVAENFYLGTKYILGKPIYVWLEMSMAEDGHGQLALVDEVLEVDVSITVTGNGEGGYYVENIIENMGPAGSVLAEITFYIMAWSGFSENAMSGIDLMGRPVSPYPLAEMDMPMIVTTGRSRTTIVDPTPYPENSVPLHGWSMEAEGVPMDLTGCVTTVSTGGLLDVYARPIIDTWTDVLFKTIMVQVPQV